MEFHDIYGIPYDKWNSIYYMQEPLRLRPRLRLRVLRKISKLHNVLYASLYNLKSVKNAHPLPRPGPRNQALMTHRIAYGSNYLYPCFFFR